MNKEELFKHHKDTCEIALNIMIKKNHDYAGADGDTPFTNFQRTEQMGICSTEKSFLVRITDKLSRLATFAETGGLKVSNESYEDAILDLINYLILFSGYVKSKGEK